MKYEPGYGDCKYARRLRLFCRDNNLRPRNLASGHCTHPLPKGMIAYLNFSISRKKRMCILFHLICLFYVFMFFIIACREGWFGVNCSQQCSGHCRDNATCNHVTGQCDGGCNAGWTGTLCEQGIFFSFCFVQDIKKYIFILVLIIEITERKFKYIFVTQVRPSIRLSRFSFSNCSYILQTN